MSAAESHNGGATQAEERNQRVHGRLSEERSSAGQKRPSSGQEHNGKSEGKGSPSAFSRAWHKLPVDDALEALGSSQTEGLDPSTVDERLERFGENRVGQRRKVSAWTVLVHQFKSPLIYVLLGALVATAVTSFITGEARWADAIVIGIVLVVNGTIGFLQEYRAEHAIEELMKMVAPRATVIRGGQPGDVEASTLVPGDVVEIGEGKVIPADLRLLDVQSLQVNEAALTGESVPVNKTDQAMPDAGEDVGPVEQQNIGFMGTAVTSGHARGLVVGTGRRTAIGRIAEQVEEAGETETPLQRRIHRLAVWITWGILIIAAIAFGIGLLMGRDWSQMIILAVALAVAAIPAGLPIVVTVALAIGVRRMAEQHAVIRHLPAVDTLGSCTTIVSDKTGTLTQNRMTVRAIYAAGERFDVTGAARSFDGRVEHDGDPIEVADNRALHETLLAGVLCNNAELSGTRRPETRKSGDQESAKRGSESDADAEGRSEDAPAEETRESGDPMEIALLYAARKGGLDLDRLRERYPRTDEVPFQTERRYMATIHAAPQEDGQAPEAPLVLVKGAPEAILQMCSQALNAQGGADDLERDDALAANDALAERGLRVLGMAIGRGDEAVQAVKSDRPPQDLTFVGFQGMLDPPRASAVEAVDRCHEAGIRAIMVTGDHARTAAAIAHQVHIDEPARALYQPSRDEAGPGDADGETSEVRRREGTSESQGEARELPEAHTGKDIADLSDEELDETLARTNVFARVEPIQKTRLVERLKARGQIVAVTGDGVNDAPALKSAHIGAAMGAGTEVAKEASDMVITDDNFASVYHAVEQGRSAFRNIRMATFFLLSTGAAMVLVILSALGLDWPLPFLPAQILWCNVVTNGIADVALAFEPGERALYRRPPRPPSEGVLDRFLLERLVLVGIWLAIGTLGMFLWKWGFDFSSWQDGEPQNLTLARTAALTTMVLFQKVHVFNCRSEDVSIFRKSLLSNTVLLLGALTSLAVHVAAVYVPWMQDLLGLTGLDGATWLWAIGVASTAIVVNELHKWLRPRYGRNAGRNRR